MLPFLIKVLGPNIKIVPLLFGDDNQKVIVELANTLAEMIDKKTLIIVSTDLSHYPTYNDANKIDPQTISAILNSVNVSDFYSKLEKIKKMRINNLATLACGKPAVALAVALSNKLGFEPHLLKYANSGDYFAEMKNRVVGYSAIVFNNLNFENLKNNFLDLSGRPLNLNEQKIALQIARKSLQAAFRGENYKPEAYGYKIFNTKRGVFVTLKKHGQLRGCIGFLSQISHCLKL